MLNKPNISDAEWEVMKVLWRQSPLTANEVVSQLDNHASWSPKTIKTLLNRLVQKEAIGFEKDKRQYLYTPLLDEDNCVQSETASFLSRVTGGTLKPILAAFIENDSLTKVEIDELKQILDKKGEVS